MYEEYGQEQYKQEVDKGTGTERRLRKECDYGLAKAFMETMSDGEPLDVLALNLYLDIRADSQSGSTRNRSTLYGSQT